MSNGYNFYLQRYPEVEESFDRVNIEREYNCIYKQFSSFDGVGEIKNTYTEDYAESDGVRIYIPPKNELAHKTFECKLQLLFPRASCAADSRRFVEDFQGVRVEYYDTFRKRRATLVMTKAPTVSQERLYSDTKYQLMEFTFTNILGHTYDNSLLGGGNMITLSLETDGKNIYPKLSRELKVGERVVILTRGSAKCRNNIGKRYKSKYRWHVPSIKNANKFYIESDGSLHNSMYDLKYDWGGSHIGSKLVYEITKSSNSTFIIPAEKGRKATITYGVAIYDYSKFPRGVRMSNVCYYKNNIEVFETTIGENGYDIADIDLANTWLSL